MRTSDKLTELDIEGDMNQSDTKCHSEPNEESNRDCFATEIYSEHALSQDTGVP